MTSAETRPARSGSEPPPVPVALHDPANASGLADMLCQLLEQTVAADPGKASQARRLRGEVAFAAAEDPEVQVRIRFGDGGVELWDGPAPAGVPALTGDFLTMAHLTTGQQSPVALVARGKLRARFSARHVPFLLGLMRLLRIREPAPAPVPAVRRWGWVAAAAAAAAAAGTAWCTAGPW